MFDQLAKFAKFGSSQCEGFEGIPNEAIKASSSLDKKRDEKGCRLNQARPNAGAWCANPKKPNIDGSHHILVDLGEVRNVFAVAMQGRADRDEWVTKATVEVSEDGDTWLSVPNIEVICYDRNSVIVQPFDKQFQARYVKLIARQWKGVILFFFLFFFFFSFFT